MLEAKTDATHTADPQGSIRPYRTAKRLIRTADRPQMRARRVVKLHSTTQLRADRHSPVGKHADVPWDIDCRRIKCENLDSGLVKDIHPRNWRPPNCGNVSLRRDSYTIPQASRTGVSRR